MKRRGRKGFTLVEIMIVMIIIGILAGMIMVISFGVANRAEATKLVTNMENLRVGCILYYSDTDGWPDDLSQLAGKMDIQRSSEKWTSLGYCITGTGSDLCCVLFDLSKAQDQVRLCLAKMAEESGLLYSASSTDINSKNALSAYRDEENGYITMVVYNKVRQ